MKKILALLTALLLVTGQAFAVPTQQDHVIDMSMSITGEFALIVDVTSINFGSVGIGQDLDQEQIMITGSNVSAAVTSWDIQVQGSTFSAGGADTFTTDDFLDAIVQIVDDPVKGDTTYTQAAWKSIPSAALDPLYTPFTDEYIGTHQMALILTGVAPAVASGTYTGTLTVSMIPVL